ncbi:MAG TPA: LamG-like jellyroll fold domain-containing protein [Bryobacteraceae bacterium]|jgi:galactosylceramidase|nr:LamG-like jellyroll fold domain-containing protein [Bryobacteraceae bacterium]
MSRYRTTIAGIMGAAFLLLCFALPGWQAPEIVIHIDGNASGRTFDGFGAVSAGASSRLLIDYPEPYRTEILDYLFKPHYGAALQHLKVEIGGDTNSTDGSEPSHMHTRRDLNFQRGYEWWLMTEAKKRNPKIILDSLAWGAPGWIGDGKYYSQDMADYVVKFIQGAKSAHGLDIAFTGVWNEKPYDSEWIKLLRRTLDASGLQSTKIVAADLYQQDEQWDIVKKFAGDPALDAAVYAVGVHYARTKGKVNTPQFAKDNGKRLWSTEDQPEFGENGVISTRDWEPGGKSLTQIYNWNYIDGRMTKTEIWSPVTSYYDNLAAPNSGLMYANTPWSGHYDVQSTIWVTAHTTQFAQPGWHYIDEACGYLAGKGSYVTLKSPSSNDYTVVIETIGAGSPQHVRFELTGTLSSGPVHVWMSNGKTMFEQLPDIASKSGSFTVALMPDALYTLSTTTGQAKGTAVAPAARPFPFPYQDDFETTPIGGTPKYLADQDGAFEAQPCASRKGRCLTQVITTRPISWGISPNPFTYLGDAKWADYTVAVDAMLPGEGEVALVGRIDSADFFQDGKALWPSGYVLTVRGNGHWELLGTKFKADTKKLASGTGSFPAGTWHHLAMTFRGSTISASLDGKSLAQLSDTTHVNGMAGFGTGWNLASFDNFSITAPR